MLSTRYLCGSCSDTRHVPPMLPGIVTERSWKPAKSCVDIKKRTQHLVKMGCSPKLLSITRKMWEDGGEPGDLDVAYFETSQFGDGLELIP